jgi:Tol biopolymer transport system component
LQITFIKNKSDYIEFFAVDVTCIEMGRLCFGEPTLLFQTMPASNSSPNKPTGRINGYSWSPEGDKIVLSANKDLFIGNMNTGEWENITNSPNVEEYAPQWSQDKRYIYYLWCTQDDASIGFCKLARLDLIDSKNTFLLDTIEDSIATFSVPPNKQSIIFSVSEGFDRLYQSGLDGTNIRELTTNDLEETSPSFSLDGNLVAFVRTNRPIMVADSILESDIIMQNSNWDNENNLTDEFEGEATSPSFSFDGMWIVFDVFDTDDHFNIYIVSVNDGTVFRVTEGSDNEVSPSWRLFYESQ